MIHPLKKPLLGLAIRQILQVPSFFIVTLSILVLLVVNLVLLLWVHPEIFKVRIVYHLSVLIFRSHFILHPFKHLHLNFVDVLVLVKVFLRLIEDTKGNIGAFPLDYFYHGFYFRSKRPCFYLFKFLWVFLMMVMTWRRNFNILLGSIPYDLVQSSLEITLRLHLVLLLNRY